MYFCISEQRRGPKNVVGPEVAYPSTPPSRRAWVSLTVTAFHTFINFISGVANMQYAVSTAPHVVLAFGQTIMFAFFKMYLAFVNFC